MASTFSSSNSGLNRENLRRPDGFVVATTGFFGNLMTHTRGVILLIVLFLAIGLGITFYFSHRQSNAESAKNALYLAEKALDSDLKKVSDRFRPPAAAAASEKKPTAKTTPEEGADPAEAVLFKKIDVDTEFSESVPKLKALDQNFSGTHAAYEANLKLAHLYFDHGDAEKALSWLEKAFRSAPGRLEKVLALTSLGKVRENLGKHSEALQDYEKALNMGEKSLKGDILLGMARCYEVTDGAKARGTYEKILTDLPNTDYAKTAEVLKNRLK